MSSRLRGGVNELPRYGSGRKGDNLTKRCLAFH